MLIFSCLIPISSQNNFVKIPNVDINKVEIFKAEKVCKSIDLMIDRYLFLQKRNKYKLLDTDFVIVNMFPFYSSQYIDKNVLDSLYSNLSFINFEVENEGVDALFVVSVFLADSNSFNIEYFTTNGYTYKYNKNNQIIYILSHDIKLHLNEISKDHLDKTLLNTVDTIKPTKIKIFGRKNNKGKKYNTKNYFYLRKEMLVEVRYKHLLLDAITGEEYNMFE